MSRIFSKGSIRQKHRLLVAMSLLYFAHLPQAWATVYISESFTGETAPGWVFSAGTVGQDVSDQPALTAAASIDPAGSGWLRLNSDTTNQATFSYYDTAVPTVAGLVITFDFVIWTTSNTAGDGFALTLFQPTITPEPGGYGGSLGYAQRNAIGGMTQGVLGVGFDVFGNFSNPNEGRIGGPERLPHSIAVRGPMGETRNDGYAYIGGTDTLPAFSTSGSSTTRDSATVYTTRVTISPTARIQVDWRPEGGEWETLFDCGCESGSLPEELMIGFTAGTGNARSTHEIRNFSVAAIPEPSVFLMALVGGCLLLRRKRE